VSLFADTVSWFADGENWSGSSGVPTRFVEHVQYSAAATVAAAAIALPVGIWLGHLRRFGTAAINVANIGRAVPSLAVILLAQQIFGLDVLPLAGPTTVFVALTLLGLPPMLINAYTGMAEVDDEVRDAARGMGYTGWQRALKVELPVATPLILTGVRISAVQIVATATLAAFVGSGGLGRYIIDGLAVNDDVELLAGAILVAALALATEALFSGLNRLVVAPGLQRTRRTPAAASGPV